MYTFNIATRKVKTIECFCNFFFFLNSVETSDTDTLEASPELT